MLIALAMLGGACLTISICLISRQSYINGLSDYAHAIECRDKTCRVRLCKMIRAHQAEKK